MTFKDFLLCIRSSDRVEVHCCGGFFDDTSHEFLTDPFYSDQELLDYKVHIICSYRYSYEAAYFFVILED